MNGTDDNGQVVLRMKNVSKTFPGVRALNNVSFDLRRGEIHALVGENGAGKSTLMKVLGGAYLPDSGEIEIDGENAHITSPRDGLALGVSVFYQEFNLVPTLNIAENIFLGKELAVGPFRTLDRSSMRRRASETLKRLGFETYDLGRKVRDMSVAQQQLIEIGKALFNDAHILVMDEPTAVLSQRESDTLFELMRELKRSGIAIIYVSHRLDEVLALSDRITVLRDGELVTTFADARRATKDEIIRAMVGRSLTEYFPDRQMGTRGAKVLSVKHLSKAGLFDDISFDLYKGEILGFYGLVGAGRTEIMQSVFGAMPTDSGEVVLGERRLDIRGVTDAIDSGIALVPEDRKREGLVTQMTMGENICLPNLMEIQRAGHILKGKSSRLVNSYMEKLAIRPNIPSRAVSEFSGGNQQKAVISKWLATNPDIIIFDEPTRGVDVGAKTEIYHLIAQLSEQGVAIVFVSSELMEILGMCDRILVIHEGAIAGEFSAAEATQEKLMRAAAGYHHEESVPADAGQVGPVAPGRAT